MIFNVLPNHNIHNMSLVGDILSVTKDLEGRAKDRRDIDELRQIQSLALTLQTHNADIVDRDIKLMQEIAEVKAQNAKLQEALAKAQEWDTEAARYQFVERFPGTFVYARKPPLADGEPMHYLCPACFQKRQKSFLQDAGIHGIYGRCHQCDIAYQLRPDHDSGGSFAYG